jgi:hypothetical protein
MRSYRRITLLFAVLTVLGQSAWAFDDDEPKWAVRANFGSVRLHSYDRRDNWGEVRVGRVIGSSGRAFLDGGISASAERGGYGSMTGGVEVRPFPGKPITPFVRGEAGMLGESDFIGFVAGIGGGAAVRLNRRFGLRAGATLSTHGGARGPVTVYSGIEFRW